MSEADLGVRSAGAADAEVIGRLLHDFNTEYDEITPGPEAVANRVRELLAGEDFAVLLGGSEPRGLVVLRFRPSIWTPGSSATSPSSTCSRSIGGRGWAWRS